ncbi:hypothetical protein PO124_22560 [Bacillus licheniformis]|nr:hypothetical protein [Bacillus licheniformis]
MKQQIRKRVSSRMVSYAVSTYLVWERKEEESLRYLSNWTKGNHWLIKKGCLKRSEVQVLNLLKRLKMNGIKKNKDSRNSVSC